MTVGLRAKVQTTVAERRRKVAALYLRHVDQVDIASQLGVDQSTVSRDLAALRQEWRASALTDTSEVIAHELAALNLMERDCVLEGSKSHEPRWWSLRLKIMERRAALLGLDATKRFEHSGAVASVNVDLDEAIGAEIARITLGRKIDDLAERRQAEAERSPTLHDEPKPEPEPIRRQPEPIVEPEPRNGGYLFGNDDDRRSGWSDRGWDRIS